MKILNFFEILGPHGSLETPWGDDEPLRTPQICLKSEYKLLPNLSMQFQSILSLQTRENGRNP